MADEISIDKKAVKIKSTVSFLCISLPSKATFSKKIYADNGANVLPIAIAAESAISDEIDKSTKKAAAKIDGITRSPKRISAATAMPVGSHISAIWGPT